MAEPFLNCWIVCRVFSYFSTHTSYWDVAKWSKRVHNLKFNYNFCFWRYLNWFQPTTHQIALYRVHFTKCERAHTYTHAPRAFMIVWKMMKSRETNMANKRYDAIHINNWYAEKFHFCYSGWKSWEWATREIDATNWNEKWIVVQSIEWAAI